VEECASVKLNHVAMIQVGGEFSTLDFCLKSHWMLPLHHDGQVTALQCTK